MPLPPPSRRRSQPLRTQHRSCLWRDIEGVHGCDARRQTEFEDILGKSERILKTPIPLSYTRMTSRFLMLWLALLPVALYQNLGWSCVPTEAFIAFCFMGIEEIGVQIEEPFSILALEAICGSVQDNCVAMVQAEERDLALIQRSDRQY